MAAERERSLPIPRAELGQLRFGALLNHLEEWIHKNYIPAGVDLAVSTSVDEDEDRELSSETTLEVLEMFSDVLDAGQLTDVASLIDKQSTVWTRRRTAALLDDRLHTVLIDSESEAGADRLGGREPLEVVAAAHEKLQAALRELNALRSTIEPPSSKIGGNFPPEEIGLPPYSEADAATIHAAVAVLQRLPAVVPVPNAAAEDAAEVLQTTGEKLIAYACSMGDAGAKEFAKSFGKVAGAGAAGMSLWALLGSKLMGVAEAAMNWLEAIKLFM